MKTAAAAASELSAVSVSEDASHRRFWERRSEGRRFPLPGLLGRTTEDGPGPSDDEGNSRCCRWLRGRQRRQACSSQAWTQPRPGVRVAAPCPEIVRFGPVHLLRSHRPRVSRTLRWPLVPHSTFLTPASILAFSRTTSLTAHLLHN